MSVRVAVGGVVLVSAGAAVVHVIWRMRQTPTEQPPGSGPATLTMPAAALREEFLRVLQYVHRQVRRVDQSVHDWCLFELDLVPAGCAPLVLLMGNHSSGKSTFTNNLCGTAVQETGTAPTTSAFTVVERADENADEDGHTLAARRDGCMRGFEDLGRWGESFKGHLHLSRRKMPPDALLPEGLLLVDTPGMIDAPGMSCNTPVAAGPAAVTERPYKFEEVTRWFARRAAVVLLFFDPANPGTTGETLEVWAKALSDYGDAHKLVIVLNKVDECQSASDFARTYGTLCWNLARVLGQKDIPRIETMFNSLEGRKETQLHKMRANKLPVDEFTAARKKVVAEVLGAPTRHHDNELTTAETTVERLIMVCKVLTAATAEHRWLQLQAAAAAAVLCVPLFGWGSAIRRAHERTGSLQVIALTAVGMWPSVAAVGAALFGGSMLRLRLWEQRVGDSAPLEQFFVTAYGRDADAEALRQRWDAGGGGLPALQEEGSAECAGVKGRLQQALRQRGGLSLVQSTSEADMECLGAIRSQYLPRLRNLAAALKKLGGGGASVPPL
eukprot:TRINITY_DN1340_c0_g3_i1.p1 TRINITY_DN1340_c0_g3~~TRINITY_DN1340_c0_g3_i1.p1  ORF type:complete len:556 (+),score=185.61 TRINITY_DN1340_c0_g3_i1:65-1732(+)